MNRVSKGEGNKIIVNILQHNNCEQYMFFIQVVKQMRLCSNNDLSYFYGHNNETQKNKYLRL